MTADIFVFAAICREIKSKGDEMGGTYGTLCERGEMHTGVLVGKHEGKTQRGRPRLRWRIILK
jgi:hypothetical protein